jgi:predicted nucleotidyltransferase
MNQEIIAKLQYTNSQFPEAEFIIFGSYAKGTNTPLSDIDLLVIFPELHDDPFDLSYKIRKEIHKYVDGPIDVLVLDKSTYNHRKLIKWSLEHTISKEGVPI